MAAPTMLRGRRRECETLDRLTTTIHAGRSGVLVGAGEPGVERRSFSGVRRRTGDGLPGDPRHQRADRDGAGVPKLAACCAAARRTGCTPGPQRGAWCGIQPLVRPRIASWSGWRSSIFCRRPAGAANRGVLINNGQWLDQASAQALAFVGPPPAGGFGALRLHGTRRRRQQQLESAARARRFRLAGRRCPGAARPGHPRTAGSARCGPDRRGDTRQPAGPELTRSLTSADLAGVVSDARCAARRPDRGKLPVGFEALPADTGLMLLIAAAEPLGDPMLVSAADRRAGIGLEALALPRRTGCCPSAPQ